MEIEGNALSKDANLNRQSLHSKATKTIFTELICEMARKKIINDEVRAKLR